MFKKSLEEAHEFLAGDKTHLREILHPHKDTSAKIGYSLAHARLTAQTSSLPHRLASSEVYYILGGEGVIHIDTKSVSIKKGDVVYVPPGSLQSVDNTKDDDLIFICIVEPAWTLGSESVIL